MNEHARPTRQIGALLAGAALALVAGTVGADAVMAPGTNRADVTFGADNDNAANPFIQPPGVTAKQHMDNTDVLFGRGNDDLLVGKLGDDTLVAGPGDDVLVGGPEAGSAPAPNSDVLLGEAGDDINIWAPGDGSDAFAGDQGKDTMVFAPFVLDAQGDLVLRRNGKAKVPAVDTGGNPAFSCTIVPVPKSENLGAQFLVRFNVNGTPVVTVRQKDVEKLVCPSPTEGYAQVASLVRSNPSFREVPVSSFSGALGVITAGS
jgi:RTX calcium-binding nonapeptide repeat (4 copies)